MSGRTRVKKILRGSCVYAALVASLPMAQAPAAPQLLFNMTLQNETRLPLEQNSITTPNVWLISWFQ
jgi:hypothetical protein